MREKKPEQGKKKELEAVRGKRVSGVPPMEEC